MTQDNLNTGLEISVLLMLLRYVSEQCDQLYIFFGLYEISDKRFKPFWTTERNVIYFMCINFRLIVFFCLRILFEWFLVKLFTFNKIIDFMIVYQIIQMSLLVYWILHSDLQCFRVALVLRYSTHWGRVTHICVSKLTIIGSDDGLSPDRHQAIMLTNAGILLIGPLGTNFSEILIKIHAFSFKKMHLKMSSGKWRPFCLGLHVLNPNKPLSILI